MRPVQRYVSDDSPLQPAPDERAEPHFYDVPAEQQDHSPVIPSSLNDGLDDQPEIPRSEEIGQAVEKSGEGTIVPRG